MVKTDFQKVDQARAKAAPMESELTGKSCSYFKTNELNKR
jgi:hypothetical protein